MHVFTAADLDLTVFPPPPFFELDARLFRPFVASEKVRFAGEIVAVVLAESREQSVDAAELVIVDFDPLDPVTDAAVAAEGRDPPVRGRRQQRVRSRAGGESRPGPVRRAARWWHRGRLTSQRMAVCPIEPRATAAEVDDARPADRLAVDTDPAPGQDAGLSGLLGTDADRIRVVAPDVGGGFGGKGLAVEDVLVAHLAQKTGRPVRWTETRSENLVAMHHGRAQRLDFEVGGSRDGRIEALRVDILQDAGAYPGLGVFLPTLTAMMSSGVYRIPSIDASVDVRC